MLEKFSISDPNKIETILVSPRVRVFEFDPNALVSPNYTLEELLTMGYQGFASGIETNRVAPVLEDEYAGVTQYALTYAHENVMGTLSLLVPLNGSTGIDRFFRPQEPTKTTTDLVSKTTGLQPPFVTIGRLTIAERDSAGLSVRNNPDAFMHLSYSAALIVEKVMGQNTGAVMVARKGLMRILNNLNLGFVPVEGLTMRTDEKLDEYKAFYSRYWQREPLPAVYATTSSQVLKATEKYVNGGKIGIVTTLAHALLKGLGTKILS